MPSTAMLNCKSIGPENGDNIVILHGLFGDLNNWRGHAERLSDRYQVHSMDCRNHGRSPHINGMAYPQMAADVAHTCATLGIKKTHIIGHSMGGKIAMQLALTYQSLVMRLVIVDIGPRRYPHHHEKIIEGMLKLATSTINSRADANSILQPYVEDQGLRSFLLKNLQPTDNKQYKLRVNINEIAACYDDIADSIKADSVFEDPVLFIKGAESDYLNQTDRAPIAALFEKTSLKTIAGAGHWPHSEKPDVIYKILSDFLDAD